jgi:hypothetical protein
MNQLKRAATEREGRAGNDAALSTRDVLRGPGRAPFRSTPL